MTIIEDVVDSDNEKLSLYSRLKANFFKEYREAKVDCFEKRVDGILELMVGSEMQEMKPIKRTQRKNQALLSRKKIEFVNGLLLECVCNQWGVHMSRILYRLLILF